MSEVTGAIDAPSFQFAFKGPGLSVSISSDNPNIVGQYAALTFGFGPALASAPQQEAQVPVSPAPQPEAPKQTRSRAKDKEAVTPGPVAVPDFPAPAAEPTKETAPADATPAGTISKDHLVEKTVEAFGKDRGKVSALLADFSCKRFSELKEDQYAAYGEKLAKLLANLGGKA
jgi:hypothetical protein